MTVFLADTFTKALRKLSEPERKQAKITALDVQTDPDAPGLRLHRIETSRDPGFWSARVNRDLRIILHKAGASTLIAYVGHHDDAYAWATRRRVEAHPRTGAIQIVEVLERVEAEDAPTWAAPSVMEPPAAALAGYARDALLDWGVPPEWIPAALAADEDALLDLAMHLPAEAAEAVLCAATGAPVELRAPDHEVGYHHPDARRRFQLVTDQADLAAALNAPWDEWTIFLHPAQREFVERDFAGPARVIGSAGTGKTVVALHRAVRFAREGGRVLLTTFSEGLVEDLRAKVERLRHDAPISGTIEISTIANAVRRILGPVAGAPVSEQCLADWLAGCASQAGDPAPISFLQDEWERVVDAWGVRDGDVYRDLPRLGRRTRLPAARRDAVWPVFESLRARLDAASLSTDAMILHDLASRVTRNEIASPFDHIIVDEAQDISPAELTLLASLAGPRLNGLFSAGDIGQGIFRSPFPWTRTGVNVRGRSRNLKVNFRTSQQIRTVSDSLLPRRLVDAEGGEEDRSGVTSVFQGPPPLIGSLVTEDDERDATARWSANVIRDGVSPDQVAVIFRGSAQRERANRIVSAVDARCNLLTMHESKGHEFRAVALVACDEGAVPSEIRLMECLDERELSEVFETERHLLYVAATRARDHLWISGVVPVSEFVCDLGRLESSEAR